MNFFLKDSLLNIDDSLSLIYVCKYNEKIIAFFSLSADSIKINEPLTIRYPQYPAVKIGRLGVHKDYQNMKIGSLILSWVVGFCRQLRKDIGLRFMSVDAYNNSSTLNFYKKIYSRN
jgi:GNAT superfamily N-acetyltransferase